jgi:deoxyribose-phosphate aldolase
MEIIPRIELTSLRPDSSEEEIRRLAMAAKELRLAALTVTPVWARFAGLALAQSPVRMGVVVGYPMGTHTPSVKGLEARLALEEGAAEVTLVPNLSAYKSGHRETFRQDVAYVLKQCRQANPEAQVKVLLYVDLLSLAEQREVVRIVQEGGGRFLLVGTFVPQPITPTMFRRLAEFAGPGCLLGAMGEIRSLEEAQALLALEAARLATPWGLEIAREAGGMLR